MKAPGTLRGDRSVYDGRRLLGTTRGTTGGVLAFDAKGRVVGTFPSDRKAADALSARGRGP